MRLWLRRLDADIHRLTGILTIGISTRHEYLAEGPEGVAKAVDQSPDENKRKAKRSLIELGIDAPLFPTAVAQIYQLDRKSVVKGKSVSVRVDLGGRRIIKKKKN